jgi:hypothetical protein
MYRWFGTEEPDEVRRLRPETTPPRPRTWTARILFTVGVLGLLVLVVLFLPFVFPREVRLGPSCGTRDREVWDSIDHFVRLPPAAVEGVDGCSAERTTDATAIEVLDHYQAALVSEGWTIVDRDVPHPSITPPAEPSFDRGGGLISPVVAGSISATRDGYIVTVVYVYDWVTREDPAPSLGWDRAASFSVDVAAERIDDP